MSHETPGGEWKWRVILQRGSQYEEVLVKRLQINVPSFSQEDEMPVVGANTISLAMARFALRTERELLIRKTKVEQHCTAQYSNNKMNWRNQNIRLSHLEAEAIHIIREAVAEFRNPVMLYSIGKDSSAMLHGPSLIARHRSDFEIVMPDQMSIHRRDAEPNDRRVGRFDSVPRARRRQPRTHGFEHAAASRAAAGGRAADRGHGLEARRRSALRHDRSGRPQGHGHVRRCRPN